MKPDKRELILEAAARVFGEKGFHQATVEEIAKEAGVGKGTIYQYFDSKDEIFRELHQWFIQRYLKELESLDENEPFPINLKRLLSAYLIQMKEFYPVASKIHQEALGMVVDKCEARGAVEQLDGCFETLIRRAIERGEIKDVDPHLVLIFIEGMFASLTWDVLMRNNEQESLSQQMLELMMTGLSR